MGAAINSLLYLLNVLKLLTFRVMDAFCASQPSRYEHTCFLEQLYGEPALLVKRLPFEDDTFEDLSDVLLHDYAVTLGFPSYLLRGHLGGITLVLYSVEDIAFLGSLTTFAGVLVLPVLLSVSTSLLPAPPLVSSPQPPPTPSPLVISSLIDFGTQTGCPTTSAIASQTVAGPHRRHTSSFPNNHDYTRSLWH